MAVQLGQLLQAMVQSDGSDLHVAANSSPMIRVRGDMLKLGVPALSPPEVEAMVTQICSEAQRNELAKNKSIDFSFRAPNIGIFRANIFNQRHGLAFVFRVLAENPPTIDELKLPAICRTACSYANGLVLVTGPTGSGKSTTLAAMLNHINMNERGHILTLEDPIEFRHESKLCMVNQRALGQHFTDFASSLKAAMREDPDVILVGEMRDPETIALALKAAETGHLVMSTLHTNSAPKTIDRIINSFPAEEQNQIRASLSETLKLVVSQKLVISADGKRRICFHDVLVGNVAVANLIRDGKTVQLSTAMQTGKREGMQVLDQTLLDAVRRGDVKGEDAWESSNDKTLFTEWAPKPVSVSGPAGSSGGAGPSGGASGSGSEFSPKVLPPKAA